VLQGRNDSNALNTFDGQSTSESLQYGIRAKALPI
jgi:hypothetical protein